MSDLTVEELEYHAGRIPDCRANGRRLSLDLEDAEKIIAAARKGLESEICNHDQRMHRAEASALLSHPPEDSAKPLGACTCGNYSKPRPEGFPDQERCPVHRGPLAVPIPDVEKLIDDKRTETHGDDAIGNPYPERVCPDVEKLARDELLAKSRAADGAMKRLREQFPDMEKLIERLDRVGTHDDPWVAHAFSLCGNAAAALRSLVAENEAAKAEIRGYRRLLKDPETKVAEAIARAEKAEADCDRLLALKAMDEARAEKAEAELAQLRLMELGAPATPPSDSVSPDISNPSRSSRRSLTETE